MKKIKIDVGDGFLIKLDEEYSVLGIVMHISKSFKQSMMIGIFDKLLCIESNIDPQTFAETQFFDTPNYTGTQLLKKGDWKIVGHFPELLEGKEIPLLRAGGSVYHKDDVVKILTDNSQLRGYVQLKGQGRYSIENKLRRHFEI